jgi:hypothetical protein
MSWRQRAMSGCSESKAAMRLRTVSSSSMNAAGSSSASAMVNRPVIAPSGPDTFRCPSPAQRARAAMAGRARGKEGGGGGVCV